MLLYVDRAFISTAKRAMAEDLGFDDRAMGWIFAAFSFGYALFQIPGGAFADRLGPRRFLAAIVLSWSVFTALTSAASQLWSMVAVRFLFGASEAGAFPAIARALFSWLPAKERGIAHAVNFSASRIGASAALAGG